MSPAVLDRMGDAQVACFSDFVVRETHVAGGETVPTQPVERQDAAATWPGGDDRDVVGAEELDQRGDELLRAFGGLKLARWTVRAVDPLANLERDVQAQPNRQRCDPADRVRTERWRRGLVGAGVR